MARGREGGGGEPDNCEKESARARAGGVCARVCVCVWILLVYTSEQGAICVCV